MTRRKRIKIPTATTPALVNMISKIEEHLMVPLIGGMPGAQMVYTGPKNRDITIKPRSVGITTSVLPELRRTGTLAWAKDSESKSLRWQKEMLQSPQMTEAIAKAISEKHELALEFDNGTQISSSDENTPEPRSCYDP